MVERYFLPLILADSQGQNSAKPPSGMLNLEINTYVVVEDASTPKVESKTSLKSGRKSSSCRNESFVLARSVVLTNVRPLSLLWHPTQKSRAERLANLPSYCSISSPQLAVSSAMMYFFWRVDVGTDVVLFLNPKKLMSSLSRQGQHSVKLPASED